MRWAKIRSPNRTMSDEIFTERHMTARWRHEMLWNNVEHHGGRHNTLHKSHKSNRMQLSQLFYRGYRSALNYMNVCHYWKKCCCKQIKPIMKKNCTCLSSKMQKHKQNRRKKSGSAQKHLSPHHHFDKTSQWLSIFITSPLYFKGALGWRHVKRKEIPLMYREDHAFDSPA